MFAGAKGMDHSGVGRIFESDSGSQIDPPMTTPAIAGDDLDVRLNRVLGAFPPVPKNTLHFPPDTQSIKVTLLICSGCSFHGNLSGAIKTVVPDEKHGNFFGVVGGR